MKSTGLKTILLVGLFLMSGSSAMATIDTIKGTLTCFLGCGKNVTQFIAQDGNHGFEVVGQYVDLSTSVEITGSGVSVSYGTRKGGSNSSIIINFNVDENAAAGERTVKMRYQIETNGPDTFKVKVVKKGNITQVQYNRPLPSASAKSQILIPGLTPTTELVAATNIPVNERVLLVVRGTKLGSVELRPSSNYQNARILPGATDSRITVEIEFTQSGQEQLAFFDSSLSSLDMNSSSNFKFSYTGGANKNVQFGGTPTGGGFVQRQIGGGSSGGSNTFVDAAPRVNMLNIFRRTSQNAVFTQNGAQYFAIDSQQFCNPMTGTQTRIITVPDLRWGVTNVGTADINTAFAAQLKSGSAILRTENVAGLNPSETRDFTFRRQNSTVRVFTFANRNGCFISPTADQFFEDPSFTVVVNTNNALTEATANQNNNSRNY